MPVAAEAPEQDTDRPWGDRTALVTLSTGSYRFSSASDDQAAALVDRYRPFATGDLGFESTVECQVLRLREPLRIDPKALIWRDQYALLLDQSANSLAMTGINFRAEIEWGPPVRASLWIRDEAELVYPNVVENFLRVISAYQAVARGGLLLHSAGILVDEKAHVFPGHSGTGKTTLARKARAAGRAILSDDICLLLPDRHTGYRAFPVPFAGELGTTLDATASEGYRLGGIHFLVHGSPPGRKPLSFGTAVARLTASCPFVNSDPDRVPELLGVASALAGWRTTDELTIGRDTPFDVVRNLIEEVDYV